MPYQVRWLVPDRVLLTTFSGVLTQADLKVFIVEVVQLITNGQAPVFHISDSLAMERVDMSLGVLTSLIKAVPTLTGLGAQVDINKPHAINAFLANVGSQLLKIRTYTVPTLATAVEMIKRIAPELDTVRWELTAPPPVLAPIPVNNGD